MIALLWIGCAGPAPAPPGPPAPPGFACPEGATHHAGDDNGLLVHTCNDTAGVRTGPHVGLRTDGSVAMEGAWQAGERHGAWTEWTADGAFRSLTTYASGIAEGPRREVGPDGRVLQLDMAGGEAVRMQVLPAQTPMPQWADGQRGEGLRHAGP